jgi:Tol biopolymer transport system component
MIPQQSVAHYRITSKLGEGGMGSVWRATDTKLNREVAIKILPEAFADDDERMARFTREAQVLASLNHPNIGAIYGVEDRALVLELVEGAEPRGPLPEADALAILHQLIDALEYAHERGVIHRDLKPPNLKLTPDGHLKVLDFGLAKAIAGEMPASVPASSPTLTMSATRAGAIMGTAAYMAPEQARGQNVDKRADIWAFGAVAYELLSGRALFGGETISDTLASVLRDEPDFSEVPPRFRRLLQLCLTRDPRRRLRDISGARLLLEEPVRTVTPAANARRPWLAWAVAGVCALSAVAMAAAWLIRGPVEGGPGAVSFLVPFPSGTSMPTSGASTEWVPSPDGRHIAMVVAEASGKTAIWIHTLADATVHRLEKTEGADSPFWSPDGRSLAFFTEDRLKRVALSGGVIQTICRLPAVNPISPGNGGTWNPEGIIMFSAGRGYGLLRVPATGGSAEPATVLAEGEIEHGWPQFLPDGRHVLYFARGREIANNMVYAQELGSAKRVQVMKSDNRVVWSPPGYLLFTREATLFAQRWNLAGFRLEGQPAPLQEDVVANATNGRSTIAVSQNGVLVYRTGRRTGERQLSWQDRDGKMLSQIGSPGNFFAVSLSPNERTLAVTTTPGSAGADAWVMDIATGVMTPMTHGAKLSPIAPVWSQDSKRIAVSSMDHQMLDIEVASARVIPHSKVPCDVQDWTPDGSSVLCATNLDNHTRAFLLPLAEGGEERTILEPPYFVNFLRLSPDGKYVAYASFELGNSEIFVSALYPSTNRRRVSSAGGSYPIWARKTGKLFYRGQDGKLMEVDIRTGSNIEASLPKPLFSFGAGSSSNRFAVTADGQRFVINEFVRRAAIDRPEINVMLNWTEALRK